MSFFDVIWRPNPDWFGEIRSIKPVVDGPPILQQEWVSLAENRDRIATAIAAGYEDRGYDVYFGVLPRVRRSGTADDVVADTDILWADLDAKHWSSDRRKGKAMALASVNDLAVSPQILVDSGGGYHAYWCLDRLIPYERARQIMEGIARQSGGDHVQDGPRVLRVPGTQNRKYVDAYARIIRFDLSVAYRPSDFEGFIPIERPRRQVSTHLSNTELPEWLLELIKSPTPKGQRSEACFKVVLWLLRYGRTDEEIEMIFASTPDGIGAKYDEKGRDGSRWLRATIEAARQRA